jgi:class 3 adenylate cyclase
MKVKSALFNICCRALYESFGTDMIVRLAKAVIPGYDIHRRTGIPDNIPITSQAAAQQVLRDIVETDIFLPFLEGIVLVDRQGFMGRDYPVTLLPQIHKQVAAEGYVYDPKTGLFMENAKEKATPTWGRLVEGEERQVAFLKMDIVRNSDIVRRNPAAAVSKAYSAFRDVVQRAVTSRRGRVWNWEGDGCLCAFVFGDKETAAVLSGMEILNEIFFFNRLSNPLSAPISLRMAAHAGPSRFWSSPSALMKEETVREVNAIESSMAKADTLCASTSAYLAVERIVQDMFGPERSGGSFRLRSYAIALEDE